MQDVFPIWQPQGFSTHIIAKNLSKKLQTPTSHTGTLDPMAEGVIIVLAGETRHKKYEYAKWLKTYEFSILWGISTDTFDGLGQITATQLQNAKPATSQLTHDLENFKGLYTQNVPAFSAIKVNGRPLHWYARNDKLDEIEIPTRTGEIHEVELLNQTEIPLSQAAENLIKRISKVSGNLRQNEVITQWKQFSAQNPDVQLSQTTIKATTTKGLYIRGLVNDISAKTGIPAFTYTLTRTANGKFSQNNSLTIQKVFGENYTQNFSFESKPQNTTLH